MPPISGSTLIEHGKAPHVSIEKSLHESNLK